MYGEKSFLALDELRYHIKLAANKYIFCKVLKTHLFKLVYLSFLNQFIMYEMYLSYMNSEYVLIMF